MLNRLLLPQNRQVLKDVLRYHVVQNATAYSDQLSDGDTFTMFQGGTVTITISNGQVFANGSAVIATDIEVANGVVHLIDGVLIP